MFAAGALVAAALVMTVIGEVPEASAAAVNAGPAQVVSFESLQTGPGPALTSGGSATKFSLKLPDSAACTGDSANQGYLVQSYRVPATVDPSTLQFNSAGPVGGLPLVDTEGSPYVNKLTAPATPSPGPGTIVNIPAFDYKIFVPPDFLIPPGTYNIGIACTRGPQGPDQMEKFWNVQKTFTADTADVPGQRTWAVAAAGASTTTSLASSPAATAAAGTDVTLTATVSPAAATGTVTFKDGSTDLGTPVPLSSGTAKLVTKALAAGSHTLTASFAPTGTDFAASTSGPVTLAITDGTTTSSTSSTSSTSTSTTAGGGGGSGNGGGSGGGTNAASVPSAGGALAKTGPSSPLVPITGAFFLICIGRILMLLLRKPAVRMGSSR